MKYRLLLVALVLATAVLVFRSRCVGALYLNLGNCCLSNTLLHDEPVGKLSESAQVLGRCSDWLVRARDLGLAQAGRNLSVACSQLGLQDRTIADLNRVLREKPDDTLTHFWMGLAVLPVDWEEAISHLRAAGAAAYFLNEAQVVPEDQVVDMVEIAVAVDGSSPTTHLAAARAVLSVDPETAVDLADQAARLAGNYDRDYYSLMAEARYRLGDWAAAIEASETGLMVYPESAELHYWLAMALAKERGIEASEVVIQNLQDAIRLDPRHKLAYTALGDHYRAIGDQETSLHWYQELVRVAPGTPSAYQRLGRAYLENGNLLEAERTWRKAVEWWPDVSDPTVIRMRFALAYTYQLLGRRDKACQEFGDALRLLPGGLDSYRYSTEIAPRLLELCQ